MKKGVHQGNKLDQKIRELELRQEQQLDELKQSASSLVNSISPANIVKSAMRSIIATPGLRSTAIDTAISAGAGLLGKKLLFRNSGGIFRKIAGTAVQFFVTNFVRNKMPAAKNKILNHTNGTE